MQLQTNIGYANSKKWDGIIVFKKKYGHYCALSHKLRGGCNSIENWTERYTGMLLSTNRNCIWLQK